jgi:histidinol-phosphate aminotransferase
MNKNQPKNAYQGGAEDFKGFIRLSSNENNYGPPKNVLTTIKENTKYSNIYPELDGESLRKEISKTYSIKANQIILGAGSDEVLQMAYAAFTKPGDEVVFTKYAFAMYDIYAKNFKCKAIKFNDKKFQFNLDDFQKCITAKTKIVFLANPNNPTGSIFYKKQLINFLNKVNKKTLVILDAAYCEYIEDQTYEDGLKLVSKYPNLVITRSFSKIYSLGGLRIGWGYSQQQNIVKMYEFKKPFNVTRLSCYAAIESLRNQKWLKQSVKNNNDNRNYTLKKLSNDLINLIDTKANFIVLEFTNSRIAQKYVDFLYKNKITVRLLASYGLPNFVRMTIGTKSDMKEAVRVSNKFNV